ncbi:class I SAM-dependent methyltransferase [Cytobacillus purgationiresistens]|uniref:SAM-dependent methyltransferase n=1 Tax=Cytobacillus purgationiresistens TaxID=863449 RepID=A0ABU0AL80_9BACI|nr:class I SAM-dependent methyltransferase [Cytobacillus purgationiresistens]MDQ0272023.1 hypothetical protein [Cytobacillus purgationiresistens]
MFITTSGRTNESKIAEAKQIAGKLNVKYVARNKSSVTELQEREETDCFVVGKNRLEIYAKGKTQPFFFHPSSAMFRMKRLKRDEHDPLIEATNLGLGKTLLDCTLGLASDSIIASFAVGHTGKVTGLEGNPAVAYIVTDGLHKWDTGDREMNEAMNRVEVINTHSLPYLQEQPDNSYDCIYFDPMFETDIPESEGIGALRGFAVYEGLTEALVQEALRVTRDRVVLKDHFRSSRFDQFSFEVYKRKTAKFHYGILKKK